MVDIDTDDQVPAPSWPTCGYRSNETGSPCIGRQVEGFDHCLAHLEPGQLERALQRLGPGAELEAPGTDVNAELLARIVHAVISGDERPTFGAVNLSQARFIDDALFTGVQISGDARFSGAEFGGAAQFGHAQFARAAGFDNAQFGGDVRFSGAQFGGATGFSRARFVGEAKFRGAQFGGDAGFDDAQFDGDAGFRDAQFGGAAGFSRARFGQDAKFRGARFTRAVGFDDAQFDGHAGFSGAQFGGEARFSRARFGGDAKFSGARFTRAVGFSGTLFSGDAGFDHAQFTEAAWFSRTVFTRAVGFDDVQFGGHAGFSGAQFGGEARFSGAQFSGEARFSGAQFSGDAGFDRAQFSGDAGFDRAQFSGDAKFDRAQFSRDAHFTYARFEKATSLGPLTAGNLLLQEAVFLGPGVLEAAAVSVICTNTKWQAGVTMRLRYAEVELEGATFTVRSFVAGADQPFEHPDSSRLDETKVLTQVIEERPMAYEPWEPVLLSLRGAETSNLSVIDVDVSQCRFLLLMDELPLLVRCNFDQPPRGLRAGWAWPPVWRWSKRASLAEERHWRATGHKYSGWAPARSYERAAVQPGRVSGLYRQLRKAAEDAKNEPGAADFYYGEMEMRRCEPTNPAAERAIVWLYWLISGYGLRALRPLAALVMLSVIVTTALVGWGLAANTPAQQLTGTVAPTPHNPARIDATLSTTKAQLPPADQRWTRQRTRTALQVTLESIVFRSTAQPLTILGTWTTIAARILGPILLVLTLLAVRNRVKR